MRTVGVLLRADTVYAPDGSQKSGLPDAYLAARRTGRPGTGGRHDGR